MTIEVDFSLLLTEPALILAVSGGSDSMALMTLVSEAHKLNKSQCRLVVATVDHALRAESAAEAALVAEVAGRLGVEHRTLVWNGPKPQKAVQATARQARLGLLSQLALHIGARAVLIAHTADDLAETVLMRSKRGPGIGLAGIAPATLFQERVWFVRPLLEQRREALRGMLRQRGESWVDDPSNDNDWFERVRERKQLAEPSRGQALFDEALSLSKEAAALRTGLGRDAAGLITRYASLDGDTIRCDRAILEAEPQAAVHALRLLIATAGRAEHLPDIERSNDLLACLRSGEGGTLANARLKVTGAELAFSRDRRGHAGPPEAFISPFVEFLPSFDLAASQAIAHLLGKDGPTAFPST